MPNNGEVGFESRRSFGSPSGLVVFVLLASGLVGLLPGVLPLAATLAVCIAGLGALGILLLRGRALRPSTQQVRVTRESDQLRAAKTLIRSDSDLRLPRTLFYIGALTVTEATWRPALGLTVSEMFFIAAFAGCAFAVLRGHTAALLPSTLVAGALVFAFGGAISSLGAHSPAGSGIQVVHAVYVLLLWTWTAVMVLRTRQHVVTALALWGISIAWNGVASIAQVTGFDQLAGHLEGDRATGFTAHPNDLGGAAAVALVPALMMATRPRNGGNYLIRIAQRLVVALAAAAIVLSASIAAMLAALIATVIWLSSPSVRAPGRVAVVAGLAAALLLGTLAGGQITSPTERLKQVTGAPGTTPEAGSGQARIDVVNSAWSRIKQSPVVGDGLDRAGTFVSVSTGGRNGANTVHGAPVAVWYEAGLFGLIGLLMIVAALLTAGWRSLCAPSPGGDQLIGWTVFAAFVAWIVFALSGPFYFQQYGWFSGVMLLAWASRRDFLERAPVLSTPSRPNTLGASRPIAIPH